MNPSDGSIWARISDAGISETKQAIDAAQAALAPWSERPFQERAHLMLKIADV